MIAVKVSARSMRWPKMRRTIGTPGDLRTSHVDIGGSGFDLPSDFRLRVSSRKKKLEIADVRTMAPAK